MIDIDELDENRIGGTLRLIRKEIGNRGWCGSVPYADSSHVYIKRPKDLEGIHIYSSTPPTTSFAAANLANDKYATYQILKSSRLPQLRTVQFGEYDHNEAIELMKDCKSIVVKPTDGGHGRGVTINVDTPDKLVVAVHHALANINSIHKAIAQEQFMHKTVVDLRITCIDYKVAAALIRVPARVWGDGIHTVAELIDEENRSPSRGEPYRAPLAKIDIGLATQYLGKMIWQIPQAGEEMRVLGVANYGAGGELIDVTDNIPDWLNKQARQAAEILDLPVVGVDFLASKIPERNQTDKELTAFIIEVNKCPSLFIHDEPTTGACRSVTKKYMEYLETI